MKVLVVEDEAQIRQLVRSSLEQQHLVVTEAETIAEAYEAVDGTDFDVVILDLTLPDGSGIEVLQHLDERLPRSHVIVLSGAVTELDRIRGLELGADDYVVKPFSARELTARVLAVRRRQTALTQPSIRFGRFELDLPGRRLLRDGEEVALSASEWALLAFLAARAGHVFSRDELLATVWHPDRGWQDHASVTEHVRRVRRKIEVDPLHPLLLRTVRGVGYCFDMPQEEPDGDLDEASSVRGTVTTVDGTIVHADPAAMSLLGTCDPDDVIGAHVLDFLAPQSLHSAQDRIRQEATGAAGRSQVLLITRPDGPPVPLEITTQSTRWQDVEAVEVHLRHAADVSPHLRRFVTGLLSDVTDAVVITDMTSHVRSWNGAAERLYGWTEAEVLGRHVLDVVGTTGEQPAVGAAQAGLETDYSWHGRIEQTTRDGSTIAVRTSMSVVHDDTGVGLGIVSVNRPVLDVAGETTAATETSHDIRRGLAAGEFEVHYQPVVSLVDEHVLTVEALVRWRHPVDGLVGPASFIEVAERSDLIREVGAFVLTTACRQVALWRTSGIQISLAVNLSARELADPLLVEHITETVAAAGLDLSALWLEVTETALVDDVAQASLLLHELAGLGIGISIDDFGTGWASLTYLRRFPVHVLKIDRSFVTGVDHDPNNATIVRSILALGAELGLVVVAEGIETRAEADALRTLGCMVGQGFLFAQPMRAAEIDLSGMLRLPGHDQDRRATAPPPAGSAGATSAAERVLDGVSETEVVTRMLRRLLRIRSAAAAAALLQQTVRDLGGSLVPAVDAGADALPVDVSLGEGAPLLPRTDPGDSRERIERVIPRLAEDARHAVDLLRCQERLKTQSDIDVLTGLSNRRVLERVIPRTMRGAVIMIDLDHFKAVNDSLGHAAGDEVLAAFGVVLSRSVRAGDICCRTGGEEFVIIAGDPDLDAALGLIERVRAAWASSAPHPVTFSAGAAVVDLDGAGMALLAADQALYRAKELGPDRTELAGAPS